MPPKRSGDLSRNQSEECSEYVVVYELTFQVIRG